MGGELVELLPKFVSYPPQVSRRQHRYRQMRPVTVALCGLVSIPVALVSPYVAWGMWFLIFLLLYVVRRLV